VGFSDSARRGPHESWKEFSVCTIKCLKPMQIELVSQPDAIARWQELVDDPELAKLPYRVETDRFGRTIMSPPPGFPHVSQVGKIIKLLNELLPDGRTFADTPVLTPDGIKVPDATWVSAAYAWELETKKPLVLERAPEICIEVLSPSNSRPEMDEKRALYFAAGAHEVWLCGRDGKMEFYTPDLSAASRLCPAFPGQL
jgi:Uma2 family endonuclease